MRETVFCKHYRAMSDHKTCVAGVAYETFKGMPFERRPCFAKPGEPTRPGCDLVQLPTPEELAEEDAVFRARLAKIGAAPLGCSARLVYRLVAAGRLGHHRVGMGFFRRNCR